MKTPQHTKNKTAPGAEEVAKTLMGLRRCPTCRGKGEVQKMRRKSMNKHTAQRSHAKRRFRERFEFDFNRHVRREFVRMVQAGEAVFVEKQSLRVSLFDIYHEGNKYRVVYDKLRKNIVTDLPQEALEGGEDND